MDVIALRRHLLLNNQSIRLPSEYQEVKYLDTVDTNPYIDTGLTITDETDVEVRYYNTRTEAFVFGARDGIATAPYYNLNLLSTSDQGRFDCYAWKANNNRLFNNVKFAEATFAFKNGVATLTNHTRETVLTKDYTDITFMPQDRTIYLFAVHTGNSASTTQSTGTFRIYYARFWSGGTLVRDFIPCIRKLDDEPGMYDLVTSQFFTKQGTGSFIPGPRK